MNFLLEHSTLIGLIFFFSVFVFIAVRTYQPKRKQKMKEHAQIPLKEDNIND